MKTPINWLDFVLNESNKYAIVEAINGSGGAVEGKRFKVFDTHRNHYAFRNQRDKIVWGHKKNFKIIEKGTVL